MGSRAMGVAGDGGGRVGLGSYILLSVPSRAASRTTSVAGNEQILSIDNLSFYYFNDLRIVEESLPRCPQLSLQLHVSDAV